LRTIDPSRSRPRALGPIALLLLAVGCSPAAPPSLSPTPEQDPTRYEQARRAAEQARQKNREAERTFMKLNRNPLPAP
jgi:hypothetical protein